MINIAIQSFLRPALTAVPHCHDYAVFKDTLERIERLLIDSSVERQAIEMALEDFAQAGVKQQHKRAPNCHTGVAHGSAEIPFGRHFVPGAGA